MSSARGLFRLHLAVGALAVGTVALSATVAARAVDFAAPSFSELVMLCGQALVPSLDLSRVALLVLAGLSALVAFRAVRSAIMVVSLPGFSALAAAQFLQRRRVA